MKRILALLLATIMIVAMCCSCGGSDESENVIKIYMPADPQQDLNLVVAEANKIVEKKLGMKMEVQLIDTGAYAQKMNLNMSARDDYDICFVGYINKFNTAVSLGGLMQLDDLLKEVPTLKKQIPQYLWDAATFEGGIYAVPNEQINATKTTMFTFKDLADKYDLADLTIKKKYDIEPFLKKIKENEPNLIPYRLNSGGFSISDDPNFRGYETVTSSFVFKKGDPKCKVVLKQDDPAVMAGVARRVEWLKKGYIRQDAISVTDDTMDYKAGKYAVWSAVYKPGVEADMTAQFGGREVIAIHTQDDEPYITNNNCVSTMLAIGANSKHPVEAIKLIELFNTDKELYNLMAFGIKGKHYNLNADNKVELIENSGYTMEGWKWGCQFNSYLLAGQADDTWEETKRLNEEAEKSPLMGFVLDTTPIEAELANYSSVASEYKFYLEGYSLDYMDYKDEYEKKLANVDVKAIKKELQKQIDAHLAQKKKK